jgi:outer membrane protein OmpA-like peptidoglycan-associated protein
LKPKGKDNNEGGPKVPGYIVTFSDMVTLLLTFFVMLLSLAKTQDQGLFRKGQASFVEAIQGFGLGILQGRNMAMDFSEYKVKYEISEPDEDYKGRTVSANTERMRRILNQLNDSMQTMPSQIVGERSNITIADFRFALGNAKLDDSAKLFLSNFCFDLQQNTDLRFVKLYVLGLAHEEKTEKGQWIVSAKRAKAVSDYLKIRLGGDFEQHIYSWGAGSGGEWIKEDSPFSPDSQIFITIISTKKDQLSSALF